MLINAKQRECDKQGCGYFGAPRGRRMHKGIDLACIRGSEVLAVCEGTVTKIGFPYDPSDAKKGHLRYVQVTDADGRNHRYFYVWPSVEVGFEVKKLGMLGVTQGLIDVYPGITDHFHYEVIFEDKYLNPNEVLKELENESK